MPRSASPARSPRRRKPAAGAGVPEWPGVFSQCAAENDAKRWFEGVTVAWSIVWVLVYGTVIVTRVYEDWADPGYLAISLFACVPNFALPWWLSSQGVDLPHIGVDPERHMPVQERYWFKACVWIAILSFVGNYFWTHYFYVVLDCSYSFPVVRVCLVLCFIFILFFPLTHAPFSPALLQLLQLNDVPVLCYLLTFSYFHLYHVMTNGIQRAFYRSRIYMRSSVNVQRVLAVILIFVMAYITALMEVRRRPRTFPFFLWLADESLF
jgi:cycloeucalenol cycloisomerase